MSVDYFFACRKCKESIHVAQDGMSGYSFYKDEPDCMRQVMRFLADHTIGHHNVRYIDEHQEMSVNYKRREWKRHDAAHGESLPKEK